VIMLTTSIAPPDLQRAYSLGTNSYLRKGGDLIELGQGVRITLKYWLQMNQAPACMAHAGIGMISANYPLMRSAALKTRATHFVAANRKAGHVPNGATEKNGTFRKGKFHRAARACARATGHPFAFGFAFGAIIVWALTGPVFRYSDTWQLVINTATTIVTFLMVFLIQNSQNRDSEAVQLKLDELLRSTQNAHTALLDIEELSAEELDQLKLHYATLAEKARRDVRTGKSDLTCPEIRPTGE
jgi:low affinity Fe/Cu permease